MKQAERIDELERRIVQVELVLAQLCEDAQGQDDDGPVADLDGNVTPMRDGSVTSL